MSPAPASTPGILGFDLSLFNAAFWDAGALFIVLTGTVMATLARVGAKDMILALRSAAMLTRAGFDENANRTAFARWARAIRKRGVLGAESAMPPDPDLGLSLLALVRTGSINALHAAHEDACAAKLEACGRAVRVFEQAGELAPVFGLVGTLFSMTQLTPGTGAEANALTLGAIATAVLSSLYGVLAAHFLFLPLAHAIARRAQAEEEAREALIQWLATEIANPTPGEGRLIPSCARVTPIKTAA